MTVQQHDRGGFFGRHDGLQWGAAGLFGQPAEPRVDGDLDAAPPRFDFGRPDAGFGFDAGMEQRENEAI